MSDYQQKVTGTFNERMRLIRLRRKKENLRFWEEFRIVPRGLIWTVLALFVVAQTIAFLVDRWFIQHGETAFPELLDQPALDHLALAGVITLVSLVVAALSFLIGYVNRDAKRRGMNSALWTLLVIIFLPGWLFIGFVIYFLMREPLPYPCPQCGKAVGPRYNFCPNCKCNLHPSCPNCKREVMETDTFCPYCGGDLKEGPGTSVAPVAPSSV